MADQPPSTVTRTFKVRLIPRKGQHRRLMAALDHTRDLYNAALQERIDAYRKEGAARSYVSQCGALTELRKEPSFSDFPVSLQRWPLKKVDLAFAAFFSRVRRGVKAGHPRFKGKDGFKSFGLTDKWGWQVAGARLYIKGIGRVRFNHHRALPSAPVSCQIKRVGAGWVALLLCEVPVEPLAATGRAVGLDMGLTSFVASSTGESVPGFRAARRSQAEMRRRQRALSRCKRGSNNRRRVKARLERLHERTALARRTFHHQTAARIVRDHDLIAIENLNIKGLAKGILARDIHDAGWASFTTLLAEKAEKAGRRLVKVDPRHTSQTCPSCGTVRAKLLSERVHRCDCGFTADRDVAAAQVILMRAVAGPLSHNVGGCVERAALNIGRDADTLPHDLPYSSGPDAILSAIGAGHGGEGES